MRSLAKISQDPQTTIFRRLQSHECCFCLNLGNHYWVPMAWVLSLWQVCQFVPENLPSHHWGKCEREHAHHQWHQFIQFIRIHPSMIHHQFSHQWSIMHLSLKTKARFISQNIKHRSPRPKEWRICRSCCASGGKPPSANVNGATEMVMTFYDFLNLKRLKGVLWNLSGI